MRHPQSIYSSPLDNEISFWVRSSGPREPSNTGVIYETVDWYAIVRRCDVQRHKVPHTMRTIRSRRFRRLRDLCDLSRYKIATKDKKKVMKVEEDGRDVSLLGAFRDYAT